MKDIALRYASNMGWLTCAICNKPVDSIEQIDDPYMDRRVFRVYCHGQVDEATLDTMTVMDSVDIKFTWAFQRQALESGNEKSTKQRDVPLVGADVLGAQAPEGGGQATQLGLPDVLGGV